MRSYAIKTLKFRVLISFFIYYLKCKTSLHLPTPLNNILLFYVTFLTGKQPSCLLSTVNSTCMYMNTLKYVAVFLIVRNPESATTNIRHKLTVDSTVKCINIKYSSHISRFDIRANVDNNICLPIVPKFFQNVPHLQQPGLHS